MMRQRFTSCIAPTRNLLWHNASRVSRQQRASQPPPTVQAPQFSTFTIKKGPHEECLSFKRQQQQKQSKGSVCSKHGLPQRRTFSRNLAHSHAAAAYDPQFLDNIVKSVAPHPLDPMFKPKSVALIGASEKQGSVGRTILWNLMSTPFGGAIYPVNPKRKSVMGIRAYSSVKGIPERVDLAVICIPAPHVPSAIQECVDAGVKGAIVISAGFSEAGEQGKQWCVDMTRIARQGNMRIMGPNCLGLMNPMVGLNATFAANMALPGKVAVISQSGALATAILDYALKEHVGFSSFMSIGSMADIQWGDLLEYLARDPQTESILLYMESIGDARGFINAARTVALTKPIIVIKVGRTSSGGMAAASHTGSMVGSDNVLDAAFKRAGVLRVDSIQELFHMAQTLAKQPLPKGNRLCILTNAGGPSALSVDALCSDDGKVATLSPETMGQLNNLLPEHWSHGNPVDILGDAPPERYGKALEIVSRDKNIDGTLVILTPQAMSDPTQTAQVLRQWTSNAPHDKPVLASWMGGDLVEGGRRVLATAGVPVFDFPDVAAKVFNYMWKYNYNLTNLYEIPDLTSMHKMVPMTNREEAKLLLDNARSSGRLLLTELESKRLLELYGIPTTVMKLATSAQEAIDAAKQIGFPVVIKLHSLTVTHKTDVGGVVLNLKTESEVREAFEGIASRVSPSEFHGVTVQPMVHMSNSFEVIFGSTTDAQIGKTIVFGHGGNMVEVFKDTVIGLPPLTKNMARGLIHSTRLYEALKGFRGKPPVQLSQLEDHLVSFGNLVTDLNDHISEIDVNPLIVSSSGIMALDCRVVLIPRNAQAPQLAVREYPFQYVTETALEGDDKRRVRVRPIRPEDHVPLISFFEHVSQAMVNDAKNEQANKYLQAFFKIAQLAKTLKDHMQDDKRLSVEENKSMWDMLIRLCMGNYDREMVLVVELEDSDDIIALGLYTRSAIDSNADISVIVREPWQNKRIGSLLCEQLVRVAKAEGVETLIAHSSKTNTGMQKLCKKLGFWLQERKNDVIGTLELVNPFQGSTENKA